MILRASSLSLVLVGVVACTSGTDDLFGSGGEGGASGTDGAVTSEATSGPTTSDASTSDTSAATDASTSSDGMASASSGGMQCAPGLGDCEGLGCTIDVYTHAEHCGACGHGCLGGACVGGACQAVVLAEPTYGRGIALDADHVYYADYLDGEIRRVAKAGGQSELLATAFAPMRVAVDATHVYWSDYGDFSHAGNVARAPKGGGQKQILATPVDGAVGVAVDATSVYFTDWNSQGAVSRVPLGGGVMSQIASAEPWPRSVFVDGGTVYWTGQGSTGQANGVVRSKASSGGPESPLSIAVGQFLPEGIAAFQGQVYWTTYYGNTVMRAPVNGGPATMIASGMTSPSTITVDASGVYWVEEGYSSLANGGLWKADHAGGAPVLLRANEPQPQFVAVDGEAIYWSSSSGILKLAK